MKGHLPIDGQLVDVIPHIAPTIELQHKPPVNNPKGFYYHQ